MVNLFAHRGFHTKDIPQNSIASLNAAVENHFENIEFDIWFVDGKLLIKHDEPLKNELQNLPTLRQYFHYKNGLKYWLDFKNLDEKNIDEALKLVKNEIELAALNPDQIWFAPCITNYELAKKICKKFSQTFGQKAKIMTFCEEKNEKILRDFFDESGVKFVSIFHKLIDKNFLEKFPDIEIFAWTVNDLERLSELESLGVKNFATDKITPQIYGAKT